MPEQVPESVEETQEPRGRSETPGESSERDRSRPPPQKLSMAAFTAVQEKKAYVCIDLTPQDLRQWRQLEHHPEAYVATQLRKQRTEVSIHRLDPNQSEEMAKAKSNECTQWLNNEVLEAIASQHEIPSSEIMKMRWVLTWKDPGANAPVGAKPKAKARLVILGFQDPQLGNPGHETASPTPSRTARQVFLTVAAHRKYTVESGDVSTAFLQSRKLVEPKYAWAVDELCDAMKIDRGSAVRIVKGAYGLTTAPREWFETVKAKLLELGFQQSKVEPCCFTYSVLGTLHGLVKFHVDDFLVSGSLTDPVWLQARAQLQSAWKWSP